MSIELYVVYTRSPNALYMMQCSPMILQLSIDLFSLWQEGDSRFLLWNNFYSLALNVIA